MTRHKRNSVAIVTTNDTTNKIALCKASFKIIVLTDKPSRMITVRAGRDFKISNKDATIAGITLKRWSQNNKGTGVAFPNNLTEAYDIEDFDADRAWENMIRANMTWMNNPRGTMGFYSDQDLATAKEALGTPMKDTKRFLDTISFALLDNRLEQEKKKRRSTKRHKHKRNKNGKPPLKRGKHRRDDNNKRRSNNRIHTLTTSKYKNLLTIENNKIFLTQMDLFRQIYPEPYR